MEKLDILIVAIAHRHNDKSFEQLYDIVDNAISLNNYITKDNITPKKIAVITFQVMEQVIIINHTLKKGTL